MFRSKAWVAAAAAVIMVACGGSDDQPERISLADGSQVVAFADGAVSADTLVVYKTPTCGCCSDWVDHARDNGFTVVTHDMNDLTEIKRELGVPAGQVSCHTATVRGYTLEGHVPADLIHRMLNENAQFKGLTVPGMPMGSPGMEGLIKQDYQVLSFDEDGNVSVYAER